MKLCPQCQQTFLDENLYCLSDGTPLVPVFDAPEETTLIRPFPSIQQSPQTARQGVSPIFAYLSIALLVVVVGGATIFWLKSSSNASPSAKNEVDLTNSNATESFVNKDQDLLSQQKANLQNEQELLEKEKQKLADERKKLEAQKNNSNESLTYNQTSPQNYPTTRIKFRRGSVEETISGNIGSERSFVLRTLSGQYLSASVNSNNGCVVFSNGSTSASYTTSKGDSYLHLKNNCGGKANFNLTVYIR